MSHLTNLRTLLTQLHEAPVEWEEHSEHHNMGCTRWMCCIFNGHNISVSFQSLQVDGVPVTIPTELEKMLSELDRSASLQLIERRRLEEANVVQAVLNTPASRGKYYVEDGSIMCRTNTPYCVGSISDKEIKLNCNATESALIIARQL